MCVLLRADKEDPSLKEDPLGFCFGLENKHSCFAGNVENVSVTRRGVTVIVATEQQRVTFVIHA